MYPTWDLLQRLVHWCFPVLVVFAWWSAESGHMQWHAYTGYALLVLVLWRIVWGFIGSTYAKFSQFVVGIPSIIAYFKGSGLEQPGHNPLGGWSVATMLALLLLQAISGLFNTDELFLQGPLTVFASDGIIEAASEMHEVLWFAIQGLVALHLLVVCYHQWVKKDGLITQMGFGSRLTLRPSSRPRLGLGVLVLVVIVALVVAIGLWLPEPEPLWSF
jgi:cytochrome b